MLPPYFQFTQSNLQDYVDCPRRFELRYILRQDWPALQTEPELEQEKHMRRGHLFHQLVHQLLIGLPAEQLAEQIDDEDLQRWWESFLKSSPLDGLPSRRLPEFSLSAPFAGFRLLAKYDVLAVEPGKKAVIVDWKTSLHRPARRTLQERMQTRLYPFLLVEAGTRLNDSSPILPEQVEMIYWFPEEPDNPERFTYSTSQYVDERANLEGLIAEIKGHAQGSFILTPNEKLCEYCIYRSLCERGKRAGAFQDQDEETFADTDQPLDLDFEQIGEIEF
jgi:CRISPR/Cas system-associated exonuclease Cas4 (RecB family)